jgi:hypothetical protein
MQELSDVAWIVLSVAGALAFVGLSAYVLSWRTL